MPNSRPDSRSDSRIDRLSRGLTQAAFADAVFSGRVLVFSGLSSLRSIVAIARDTIDRVFAPHDPFRAHEVLSAADYKARNLALRKAFDADREAAAAFRSMFIEAAGLEPATTYRDRLILRSSPPIAPLHADPQVVLPAHRDTWGSGYLCQINWWLPVHKIEAASTAMIYPRYWDRPVANNAKGWDWRRMRHDPAYPPLPTTTEAFERDGALPLILEPGEVAVFSGAHLHATIPNRTSRPRFSADTRTIDLRHITQRRGAPDIDHGNVRPAAEWFMNLETEEKLPTSTAP